MNSASVKKTAYRIPPSKYWEQYWHPSQIGLIATFQLIMTFGTLGMEIGNTVVDLFRANVFSGFWSFPFMILTVITTYACVCAKKTLTKAIVALIFQFISLLVMIVVVVFMIIFIVSNFTLCLGFQCSQNASTFYSSSDYITLKRAFISCELVCSVIYIILSAIYIILFIKCYKKIPAINPIIRRASIQHKRQLSNSSKKSRPFSMSIASYNRSDVNERTRVLSSSAITHAIAQKVCPNCKHVSPYIPEGNIVECPKCGYQSPLVEHAQQW